MIGQSIPWFRVGLEVTDYDAIWLLTEDGYNIEIRLGWNNFDFEPGPGKVMGWSLANNDTDDGGVGRDYQTVWYGTSDNWSNTSVLGDLQLHYGPYTRIKEKII